MHLLFSCANLVNIVLTIGFTKKNGKSINTIQLIGQGEKQTNMKNTFFPHVLNFDFEILGSIVMEILGLKCSTADTAWYTDQSNTSCLIFN